MRPDRDTRMRAKDVVALARHLGTCATLRRTCETVLKADEVKLAAAGIDYEKAMLARAVLKILDAENLGRMS